MDNLELYSHFRILFRVIFKYFRDQRSRKNEKIRDQYEKLQSITLVIAFWRFLEISNRFFTRNPHYTLTNIIEGSSYVVSHTFSSILDASRLEFDSNEEKQNLKKPYNNLRLLYVRDFEIKTGYKIRESPLNTITKENFALIASF